MWWILIPIFALAAVPVLLRKPEVKVYDKGDLVVAVNYRRGRWGVFQKRVGLHVRVGGDMRWGVLASPTDHARLLFWLAGDGQPPRNLRLLAEGQRSSTPEEDAEAWIAAHPRAT